MLKWEEVPESKHDAMPAGHMTFRARVPGGWLVSVWAGDDKENAGTVGKWGGGVAFVIDPQHAWTIDE